MNKLNFKHCLLAEDNPADQLVFQRELEDSGIYAKLSIVSSGVELLKFIQNQPPFDNSDIYFLPDIIFLDINMPVVDGISTLKTIRNNDAYFRIPIIMLTTSENPDDRSLSALQGADGYISKPINKDELIKIFF